MIPYFALRTIPLPGGGSLAAFGTLVAVGVFVGLAVAEARARVVGIPEATLHAAVAWAVIPGFLAAHVAALAPHLGDPALWRPGVLLPFWNGMSAFGGVAGAWLGLLVFRRRTGTPWLPLADVLVQGLVVGWVFGRLGCTLVHDHVGRPSAAWTAIRFPDGPRHDLGFYELCFTLLVLVPAVAVLVRKPRPAGTTIAWIALLYAPARFLGDFLRQADLPGADVRYAGLTLAQYACVALVAIGVRCARRSGAAAPRST